MSSMEDLLQIDKKKKNSKSEYYGDSVDTTAREKVNRREQARGLDNEGFEGDNEVENASRRKRNGSRGLKHAHSDVHEYQVKSPPYSNGEKSVPPRRHSSPHRGRGASHRKQRPTSTAEEDLRKVACLNHMKQRRSKSTSFELSSVDSSLDDDVFYKEDVEQQPKSKPRQLKLKQLEEDIKEQKRREKEQEDHQSHVIVLERAELNLYKQRLEKALQERANLTSKLRTLSRSLSAREDSTEQAPQVRRANSTGSRMQSSFVTDDVDDRVKVIRLVKVPENRQLPVPPRGKAHRESDGYLIPAEDREVREIIARDLSKHPYYEEIGPRLSTRRDPNNATSKYDERVGTVKVEQQWLGDMRHNVDDVLPVGEGISEASRTPDWNNNEQKNIERKEVEETQVGISEYDDVETLPTAVKEKKRGNKDLNKNSEKQLSVEDYLRLTEQERDSVNEATSGRYVDNNDDLAGGLERLKLLEEEFCQEEQNYLHNGDKERKNGVKYSVRKEVSLDESPLPSSSQHRDTSDSRDACNAETSSKSRCYAPRNQYSRGEDENLQTHKASRENIGRSRIVQEILDRRRRYGGTFDYMTPPGTNERGKPQGRTNKEFSDEFQEPNKGVVREERTGSINLNNNIIDDNATPQMSISEKLRYYEKTLTLHKELQESGDLAHAYAKVQGAKARHEIQRRAAGEAAVLRREASALLWEAMDLERICDPNARVRHIFVPK
ncbi:uncharacterized protein LOC116617613 [Nematostella vectensis]|uniref:uncharacterized protein LOC116617613 n=1 Tax=Nematostella vectensis TaxID=45351 RepID=UPI0020770A1E|nr:uncharacterized protein LOC116617613 [Nematostella vectensis]